MSAIAIAAVVAIIAPPAVQAAVQTVKLAGGTATSKIKDSAGGKINSETVADMGLLSAPGSDGAIDVRNFAGGTGLLGTGDCTGDATTSRPNEVTVAAAEDTIITAIIITGTDAKVTVRAPDLDTLIGPFPVANFRANAQEPNVFVGLGTGLTVFPSKLVFKCTGEAGGDGVGDFVILGQ